MKIAFIVGQFPVLSETFILNQIVGVIERGHEVDIFAERWGDVEKVHPDVTKYSLLERTYVMQSIPNNPALRLAGGIGLLFKTAWKAPKFFLSALNVFEHGLLAAGLWLFHAADALYDKPSYDIIHCQFGTQGYRGLFFKHLIRPEPKLIVMFRGHDISRVVQERGSHIYDDLFESADYFLANCDFFRKRVVELGCPSNLISVHLSGLDCRKFKFTPRQLAPHETIRVATTGRLVEKKGIEYAIRAVAKVLKNYPNLQYDIIGDGPLRQNFEHLIKALGVEDQVNLLGWRNEQEIIQILNQAHIFIAPSVTAEDGNQDAPINVLKEAMAMGLPVVSTLHGGIPELVQEGKSGFLVPERDTEALAEKLKYLILHPQKWADMGRAGRHFVEENYDIHKLNDRLVQLYHHLEIKNSCKSEFELTKSKNDSVIETF
ncbi:MAG: glycosyltransferase [Leptolyngbyaceae cyanobacterium]